MRHSQGTAQYSVHSSQCAGMAQQTANRPQARLGLYNFRFGIFIF